MGFLTTTTFGEMKRPCNMCVCVCVEGNAIHLLPQFSTSTTTKKGAVWYTTMGWSCCKSNFQTSRERRHQRVSVRVQI